MHKPVESSRRQWLQQTLWAGLALGIRSVACGVPPAVLANPARALAGNSLLARSIKSTRPAQYLILSTSSRGDPINCNVPGTYGIANMVHPAQTTMTATNLSLGTKSYQAAAPWASLDTALSNMCFFHHATETFNHPDADLVQRLNDGVANNEMLISAVAEALSATLGTTQAAPIALGAESVTFQGRTQPNLTPLGVAAILGKPDLYPSLMGNAIVAQRDKDLDALNALAKQDSSGVQAAFLERYAQSQTEARQASANAADSLEALSKITDNGQGGQLTAALALVRMKLAPAVLVHLNFGDDNHGDVALKTEAASHVTALAALNNNYFANLATNENITFASLNVFGRDNGYLINGQVKGRDHNGVHHAMVLHGPNVAAGVIGGISVQTFGTGTNQSRALAAAIDSKTGEAATNGDIAPALSLQSAGATLGAAVGIDDATLATAIPKGVVVQAALV